ncbi:hypothetical protein [Polaromonas glacialis]|uniref:hypothetical protein n=1 Tax=Polaromonas glacialis TaxID=866564 RepID=UPI0012EBD6C0|nr:hypothetical protein [Polaromonas glacialis]
MSQTPIAGFGSLSVGIGITFFSGKKAAIKSAALVVSLFHSDAPTGPADNALSRLQKNDC